MTPGVPPMTETQSDDTRADIATEATRGGATLEEIARELGLCRERVRQIENQAILKCRAWAARRGLDAAALLDLARALPDDT